jgi:hypothetical protein
MANLLKYFDGSLPGRPQKRKPTEEQKKDMKRKEIGSFWKSGKRTVYD